MLPDIVLPNFELTLPITKTKLECRPYLVKEDKILLMAAQSGNVTEIARATRQIINNCVLSPEGFDCKELPTVDVDFLFMNLRAKSVGESSDLELTCQQEYNGEVCGQDFTLKVRLEDVKLIDEKTDKRQFKIQLKGTNLGVQMKFTTYKATIDYNPNDDEITKDCRILYNSIDKIFDDNSIYKIKDNTFEEFQQWIEKLSKTQYEQLLEFIEELPYHELQLKHTCTKCGFNHDLKFRNVLDFF